MPEGNTHIIPDGMSFDVVTLVDRHAPLALNLLEQKARLQRGEWVLIKGAAAGQGSAGVQNAKYRGGRVIAAAGADERVEASQKLTADFASTIVARTWLRMWRGSRMDTASTWCLLAIRIPLAAGLSESGTVGR